MFIVLGANGHVGSAVATTLLALHEPVTVVLHDPGKADDWRQHGARVAIADVMDRDQLRAAFDGGRRLFLLNPPAPVSQDATREEFRSVASIVDAVAGSSFERIVAESTYGAQPGDGIGDLGVLHDLETRLAALPIPSDVIRAAYYMSNWDAAAKTAAEQGIVDTLFPVDFVLPMVAPDDIGRFAATLLVDATGRSTLHAFEGPARYTAKDVAAVFAARLGRPVRASATSPDRWVPALEAMGFSPASAQSMAAMTRITLAGRFDLPADRRRGPTTLDAYVGALVDRQ